MNSQKRNIHNKPKVISTFSGCGGSSYGYKLAGYEVLLAVEMDTHAVATYQRNFPNTPIYYGDIHKLSVEKIFDITGLIPGELDLFDGSPPCQGFSTAGARDFCDFKNQLYHEYIRLLRGLYPKTFVMENVSGMVKGNMKIIFKDILRELKASGYDVRAKLMNAQYYNCPTSRQRMIFIGVRKDLGIPASHPKPKTQPIPCKKSIGHLEGKIKPNNSSITKYSIYLRPGQKSGDVPNFPTKTRDIYRLLPNKPCPTITRKPQLVHYKEDRELDVSELSILQSFTYEDNDFKWIGSENQVKERIGNSVPPNLMRAIAEHIRVNVLEKIS